jgi:uncharacterized protein YqjF (DUF2071 family)
MLHEKQAFLSAEWRDLVMLNYEVDASLLNDYIPTGTVLDSYKGRTYVSLVGFRFLRTKLFGSLPVPFHSNFDEVNLRFYVRRKQDDEEKKRGVAFISEIVPKWAVAKIARLAYEENYICLPMRHRIDTNGPAKAAQYEWQLNGAWCKLFALATPPAASVAEGSLEQFITEHHWGYSKQRDGDTLEYHVCHIPWNVWKTTSAGFEGNASSIYGRELGAVLQRGPDSAFIADGSPVVVFAGVKIR